MSDSKKGFRNTKQRVKSALGRKISSTKWLERHINDQYVALAKKEGYRSRAAFKLREMLEKYKSEFLSAKNIIDVGCAPGGWLQVLRQFTQAKIMGVDLQEIEPMAGITFHQGDFLEDEFFAFLQEQLDGRKLDIVLSDMAASSTGHRETDHLRIFSLLEMVIELCDTSLKEGGMMIAKFLKGRKEEEMIHKLRERFQKVARFKPKASYADSAECYIICIGKKAIEVN